MESLRNFVLLSFASQAAGQLFPDCTDGPLASNQVCNTSLPARERAQALVAALQIGEKIPLLQNRSPGVPRVGLPFYNWWGEALHGLAGAPGVNFSDTGEFSYATSFPQPIIMAAAFDDALMEKIGGVVSTEARAYNNANRSGLDYWTPNINPFRDPRWGRGQETPGEDPHVLKQYINNYVTGLQGGPTPDTYKIIATCKHYAAYDLEFWHGITRYEFDAKVSYQDLHEYYLQPFQQCARDTQVGSIMCSYNAINGVPACANQYLIDTVLRGHWNWTKDENYITGDCNSIQYMYVDHHAFSSPQDTVTAALQAGVDTDCGFYYPTFLQSAYDQDLYNESLIDRSLVRLYSGLVKTGYFNPADSSPYRSIEWNDVATPDAEEMALRIAEEGIVLLKNDGLLPLSIPEDRNFTILLAGGWINATTQMQGNYAGPARVLHSPWMALQNLTNVQTVEVQWYESPLLRAQEVKPDLIMVIDATTETASEGQDRNTIRWDGAQLDQITQLGTTGIPVVVAHMGEQVDDSAILANSNISALIWAGYPGMFGGDALINIVTGKVAPSGRMPVTQYPESYANEVSMYDMSLRPNTSTGNPGRTYKWFGNASVEFGYGMHYTNFSTTVIPPASNSFSIQDLISSCSSQNLAHVDLCPFIPTPNTASSLSVNVTNTGLSTSDFVTLAFISGEYGPAPYPIKSLVAYQRLFNVTSGQSQVAKLNMTIGSLARFEENGDEVLYPGQYKVLIDVPTQTTWEFELTGEKVTLDEWPEDTTETTQQYRAF